MARVTRFDKKNPRGLNIKRLQAIFSMVFWYLAKLWFYFLHFFAIFGQFLCCKWHNIEQTIFPIWSHCTLRTIHLTFIIDCCWKNVNENCNLLNNFIFLTCSWEVINLFEGFEDDGKSTYVNISLKNKLGQSRPLSCIFNCF